MDILPFFTSNANDPIVIHNILRINYHFIRIVGIQHEKQRILFQQLQSPILGQWEHIRVMVSIPLHHVRGNDRVRKRETLGIRCLCFLQRFQKLHRSVLDFISVKAMKITDR